MSLIASTGRMGGHRGGNILEFYTEEFRPEPSSVELFRQHLIQWFFAAKTLRVFEAFTLANDRTPENLSSHRMVCSALITFGEFASNYARKTPNLNLAAVGLNVDAVEVETRTLRDNFRMFHDDTMSDSDAEAVLNKAFDEPK